LNHGPSDFYEPVRQTKHQIARGAFPDAQQRDKIYLFKNVSTLRATFQVLLDKSNKDDSKQWLRICLQERGLVISQLQTKQQDLNQLLKDSLGITLKTEQQCSWCQVTSMRLPATRVGFHFTRNSKYDYANRIQKF
jgi:hypothetical protein